MEKYVCIHALRWKFDAGGLHADDGKNSTQEEFRPGDEKLPT